MANSVTPGPATFAVATSRQRTRVSQQFARETQPAFTYLYRFRRIVVPLALLAAGLAWIAGWTAMFTACLCIGIGEFLESSYYIMVLRWEENYGVARSFRAMGDAAPAGEA